MYIQPKRHLGDKVFFLARAKSTNGPEIPALAYGTIKAVTVDAHQEDGKDEVVDISYRVHVGAVHVFITDEDILTDGFTYPALTLARLEDEVKAADEEFAKKGAVKPLDITEGLEKFRPVQEDERG